MDGADSVRIYKRISTMAWPLIGAIRVVLLKTTYHFSNSWGKNNNIGKCGICPWKKGQFSCDSTKSTCHLQNLTHDCPWGWCKKTRIRYSLFSGRLVAEPGNPWKEPTNSESLPHRRWRLKTKDESRKQESKRQYSTRKFWLGTRNGSVGLGS